MGEQEKWTVFHLTIPQCNDHQIVSNHAAKALGQTEAQKVLHVGITLPVNNSYYGRF